MTKTSLFAWSTTFLAALSLHPLGCTSETNVTSPIGAAACADDLPRLVAGEDTGYATCDPGPGWVEHRPAVKACPNAVTASDADCSQVAGCEEHANCTARPHGLCFYNAFVDDCGCDYGCTTDADCRAGEICSCGDPTSTCIAVDCTSDAACGEGQLCATYGDSGCGEQKYACTTPADTCFSRLDCGDGEDCLVIDGHRSCIEASGCVIGRPFLIEGESVVAGVARGRGWCGDVDAPLALSPTLARVAADHWTKTALAEHASVAAFARFALDLMAVGAPAELVQEAHAAMGDEIEHARLAFALASRFAGHAIAPGPLPIDGALEGRTMTSILRDVVLEGCIGEAVAALEAREAAAHVVDPAVRAVLEKVAVDERRHALLAYRFVEWAIARDASLADVFLSEALAARGTQREAAAAPSDARLLEIGVVGDGLRAELRRHVIESVVLPAARALAGPLAA